MNAIRVGIIGLGANTRLRHVPGLRACERVEIAGVCNRRPESTAAVAKELDIPKSYDRWQDLIADPQIDAVVIGTWPYLHCPITLAALDAGKHVLTEARMAMNAAEAHQMLDASRLHSELVAQIVPSPFGLRAHQVVKELLADGFIGQLREVAILGTNNAVADPELPLHWRQSAEYSGLNMLTMGILHETLTRWVPDPTRVLAQTHTFTSQRRDNSTGAAHDVGTPDSVHVLTELPGGARGVYHLSGAIHFGPGMQIHLYGSEGTLKYLLAPEDPLLGARRSEGELKEIAVPPEKAGGWRVEQEFVNAIRGQEKVEFTDFAAGVRYMEFTEAVARSAAGGKAVSLPLAAT
jgi:predicted dehydrogenase